MRACGQCGKLNVPPGGDWPHWEAGMPICDNCMYITQAKPLTEEDVRRIVREEILRMIETRKIWTSENRNP